MKVYLASRYQERLTIQELARMLTERGIAVTSRWLAGDHDDAPHVLCATEDFEDIDAADVLAIWNPPHHHGTGSGGRHVEVGYAIARGKRVVLMGERENVFHSHPAVHVIDGFAELADTLLALDWARA